MPYRRTGDCGLVLPALSVGLWQRFGHSHAEAEQRDILLRAFDLGITHFDNADRYGPPHRAAQQMFGRLLATDLRLHRDELILSTKAGNPIGRSPYLRGASRKSLLASLDASLRDLGTDYVDIFYSHSPDPGTPLEETARALNSAVTQGKALYVGVSNYGAEQTRTLVDLLAAAGTPLVVHQARYSAFDRTIERAGLLDAAGDRGFGVVAYSPLAQGLLTDKYLDGIPDGARALNSAFLTTDSIDDDYRRRAASLNDLARSRGQSLAQLALQWVLRRPEISSAIVGASSPEQLDHNVAALDFPELSLEELTAVDAQNPHLSS